MAHTRRWLALTLVAGLLLPTGAAGVQEPDGSTAVFTPANVAGVRGAITFPEGWRLEASGDDSLRSAHALAVDERCQVGIRGSDFEDLATDVDDFEVTLAPGSGAIFIGRESVELPAGAAERVDFADNEEGGRFSIYSVWDDGFVHELTCRGDELPEDRWLSIARTLDIDPDPALRRTPFDPYVARPDAGVAMAFGEQWHVRGSSTDQGLLYATSPSAVCALSDYSAVPAAAEWNGVEDMHDEYVAVADARDNLIVEEAAYLELPAGRTGFAEISFDDGTRAIRYSFADPVGERLMALFCVGDPTPDDRYRRLAESVEWLPSND